MSYPLLSVVMPVWNGEMFLSQAIESILAQHYENIELIILDNLSIDRTREICLKFAKNDTRVRYILDDEKRDFVQAEKKVSQYAKGTFIMVASDDDWYAPEYVSTIIRLMMANPSIGLAYSGWDWVCSDGSKKPSRANRFLRTSNSEFYNFAYYLFFRTPIPLVFGIVRTELHRDALNYLYRPDQRGWNHDNLYILRLLSMARVESTTDILFYYRERDRVALYKQRGTSYAPDGALAQYLNSVRHQMSVTQAIAKIIDVSSFATKEKHILKAYSLLVLFFYCTFILTGVKRLLYRLLKRFLIVTGVYNLIRKK